MSKETTYIGTKLGADDYRAFSVMAAQNGKSRSAMLADLAREFIARPNAPIPNSPTGTHSKRRKPAAATAVQ